MGKRLMLRRVASALLIALSALVPALAAAQTVPGSTSWIRNVAIVDPADGTLTVDQAIGIRDGLIVSVGPDSAANPSPADTRIDGKGRTAIPGLWDAHVHLLQGSPAQARAHAASLLAAGVTHVRDMGSSLDSLLAFRADIAASGAPAPQLLASGPAFWTFELPYGDAAQKRLVKTAAETDAEVDRLAAAGVDHIKLYAGFDWQQLAALVTASGRNRLTVSGHAQTGLSLADHAEIGVSTVEHVDFATFAECSDGADAAFQRVIAARFRKSGESIPAIYAAFAKAVDTPQCRDSLRRAGAAGLALTPTLITAFLPEDAARKAAGGLPESARGQCDLYLQQFDGTGAKGSPDLKDASRRLVSILIEAEIPLLAGTDAPAFCAQPGPSLARELQLLADAGLTPLAVLQAATLTPARQFGVGDRHGRIAVGLPADLVLLQENPLMRADAYDRPVGVYSGGRWWGEAELKKLRSGARKTP